MKSTRATKKIITFPPFRPPGSRNIMRSERTLWSDTRVSFPEDPETVQQDIRDIGPQIIFFAARQLEAMARIIQAKIVDTGFLKRFAYNLFLPVAYRKADMDIAGAAIRPAVESLVLAWQHHRFPQPEG